jgi:glycerol-1-phosphate dehydrogenase [NAD(P)+]
VVLADIDIISNAPPEMTAAGYADLFAKIPAGADWILADKLGVEAIDLKAWHIVQDGLHDALSNPEGVRLRQPEAISKLVDGLMLSGFAMQRTHTSRPASGAEHQFSHLWNMEYLLHNGRPVSHGFQVGIATLSMLALYEQILATPITQLNIAACCKAWPTAEESEQQVVKAFEESDFPNVGITETKAKYINREQLAVQLALLVQKWPAICTKLKKQLLPYAVAKEMLQAVGAPVEPEQISVSREMLQDTFIRAQFIRRRFTALDLAVRTNFSQQWLNEIFGKKGIWKINRRKK